MIIETLILFVIILLVLRPIVQRQREQALVEQLKEIGKKQNPTEALMAVDAVISKSQSENKLIEKTKWLWFWLR